MPHNRFIDPTQARAAAYQSWANTEDRTERTAPALRAFLERFERLADPDSPLSPLIRHQRAEAAKKAHFLCLAAKSAKARAQRDSR